MSGMFAHNEENSWKCPKCNFVFRGELPPKECPLCGREIRFELVCDHRDFSFVEND